MEMENVYITKHWIKNIHSEELDYELRKTFNCINDDEDGDDADLIELQNDMGIGEGEPILIDNLIEMLQELKTAGATHVEIGYHCDHLEYDMSGFKIVKSTPDEIESYKLKLKLRAEKQAKVNKLEAEIKKIINS